MNHTFRLIWSEATLSWIVVSEHVKGRGKRASACVRAGAAGVQALLRLAPLAAALSAAGLAQAAPATTQLPTAGQVVAGSAAISQNGAAMTILQGSERAAIDWGSFNIGSGAQVRFQQPSASSVALNRVLDNNPSQIFGSLSSNGQVFLTNPNGVYFAPGARADVGALVATTHAISTADFMAGKDHFERAGATGSVVNEGTLTSRLGGYIALLAPEVRNAGVVVASLGSVTLAAGDAYDLQFDGLNGTGLATVRVTPATIDTLVENGNAVRAPGGVIVLSAQAAHDLHNSVVKSSGTLEAGGLSNRDGRIVLDGGSSTASGAIQAANVQVLGDAVTLAGARIDATNKVEIGGSWQNSDAGVRQARTTVIDSASTVTAGQGSIAVWSDVTDAAASTRVDGRLSTKGGRIETSGHALDVSRASVDAGVGGTWLLDPYNITIASSGAAGTAYAPTFAAGADSTILASQISASLAAGTNVTISTQGSGTGASAGNIRIASGVNINPTIASGAPTLTLNAYRSISMDTASIQASGNPLNVVFASNYTNYGTGSIYLNDATIKTNGGNLTLGGANAAATGNAIGDTTNLAGNGIGVFLYAANASTLLDAGGGNIAIRGAGQSGGSTSANGIEFQSNITVKTAGSGTITIAGTGGSTSGETAHGLYAIGNTLVTTENGALNMTLAGGTSGGSLIDRGSSGLDMWGGNVNTSGSGAVTITGYKGSSTTSGQSYGIAYNQAIWGGGAVATIGGAGQSGNITLNTDTIKLGTTGVVRSTGALTIAPTTTTTTIGVGAGSGTLALPQSLFWNGSSGVFADGFSGITIGSATQAGAISVSGLNFSDPLSLMAAGSAGSVSLAGTIANVGTGTGSGALTAKAGNGVTVASGSAITTQGGDVTLWSDSDYNSVGGVYIGGASATSISTNGGALTLGGGSALATGYAVSSAAYVGGVHLDNATLNTNGGAVQVRGKGLSTGTNTSFGIMMLNSSSINSAAGAMTLNGVAAGSSMAAYNAGLSPLTRWNSEVRDQGDPLLYMESIPYWETRGYVA
ncbi:MAG: filamentous hemagglutinin N-terminal domain-containing protein, partial [Gammaproteobacteria bacterium]